MMKIHLTAALPPPLIPINQVNALNVCLDQSRFYRSFARFALSQKVDSQRTSGCLRQILTDFQISFTYEKVTVYIRKLLTNE